MTGTQRLGPTLMEASIDEGPKLKDTGGTEPWDDLRRFHTDAPMGKKFPLHHPY